MENPVKIVHVNASGKLMLCLVVLILAVLKWIFPESNVLSWDVFGYYLYLPAKFIYHDPYLLHHNWLNQIINDYQNTATLYQINQHLETGNWIIKYSMGMSVLYAPFFFIAHTLAPFFGYNQDGFSTIYAYLIEWGMFLFSALGLVYCYKILIQFYSTKTVVITLILIVFATNYVQLNTQYSLLTHVPLFTLYSILIYFTLRWNKLFDHYSFLWLMFSAGLITLIRPNEIICVFIPLLWNNNTIEGVRQKWTWLTQHYGTVFIGILLFVLPFLLQMYYWKIGTGHWLYYSYQNPGEGFDFLSPHTFPFLFGFRKGWFVYTPLMIIAVGGIFYIFFKNRNVFWALLIPFLLSIYISSSWSCWWYAGGSYSQRAMVSIYPLLAIPIAQSIEFFFTRLKILIWILLTFITTLNLFQAWQFKIDVLDHERMTFNYYKKIFFKTQRPHNSEALLLVNRSADENEVLPDFSKYESKIWVHEKYIKPLKGKEYTWCNFIGYGDTSSVFMDATNPFVDALAAKYHAITTQDHFWLKANVDIFIPESDTLPTPNLVVFFKHGEAGVYKYRSTTLNPKTIKKGSWNHLEYLYLTPEVRSVNDELKVYLWYEGNTRIFIDNFMLTIYTQQQ